MRQIKEFRYFNKFDSNNFSTQSRRGINHLPLNEPPSKARGVLEQISQTYFFNTFAHFHELATRVVANGGDPRHAQAILNEWDYEPERFIRENGGGNCVDFAVLAKRRLQQEGVQTQVIGKIPDDDYSPQQQAYMLFRHTPLLYSGESHHQLYMFEPSWRLPVEIPITPIGVIGGELGSWQFKTVAIENGILSQETISPLGKTSQRKLNLTPIEDHTLAGVTKRLTRVPRRFELITRLGSEFHLISFNPQLKKLISNMSELSAQFDPEELTSTQNNRLSEVFRIDDIQKYLTQVLVLWRNVPEEFWIK